VLISLIQTRQRPSVIIIFKHATENGNTYRLRQQHHYATSVHNYYYFNAAIDVFHKSLACKHTYT